MQLEIVSRLVQIDSFNFLFSLLNFLMRCLSLEPSIVSLWVLLLKGFSRDKVTKMLGIKLCS